VRQAIHCGYEHITAIELGVFTGIGLMEMCEIAEYFETELGIRFTFCGFDNAAGLPALAGYMDPPKLWHHLAFKMPDPDKIRVSLPSFASPIIGDVGETIGTLEPKLKDAPLGFIGFDMDLYSSTKRGLRILKFGGLDAICPPCQPSSTIPTPRSRAMTGAARPPRSASSMR
jgi:hypothetical protein